MGAIHLERYVEYRIRNAQVSEWPFPHFFIQDVFPEDFYWYLMDQLKKKDDFKAAEGRYEGRTFASTTGIPELDFMEERDFMLSVATPFRKHFAKRFNNQNAPVYTDLRLIRDGQNYSIGPHTDAPWKIVSLLFYLPVDGWNHQHGTSIYVPKDPKFICKGGPHHSFEDFDRVFTAPFIPNSCFGFFKNEVSFHGVEPITTEIRRDILLYNIYDQELYLRTHKPNEESVADADNLRSDPS